MTTRICKFGCPILLGEWNENARKYHEAATGELHTRERCEEAKANARRTQGVKNHNNHGNENHSSSLTRDMLPSKEQVKTATEEAGIKFVDHTQAAKEEWKHKTITDPTPEGFDLKINNFGETHKIRASQFQIAGALYTISIWYEEEGKQ